MNRIKSIVAQARQHPYPAGGKRQGGTAFLIDRKYAVTCCHCLGKKKKWQDEIQMELHFRDLPDKSAGITPIIATVDWNGLVENDNIDIAILKLETELPPCVQPLEFATDAVRNARWDSFGYTAVDKEDGTPLEGRIRDVTERYDGRFRTDKPLLRLLCDTVEEVTWMNGASGSPVVVDNKIVGVLWRQVATRIPKPKSDQEKLKTQGNRADAISIAHILKTGAGGYFSQYLTSKPIIENNASKQLRYDSSVMLNVNSPVTLGQHTKIGVKITGTPSICDKVIYSCNNVMAQSTDKTIGYRAVLTFQKCIFSLPTTIIAKGYDKDDRAIFSCRHEIKPMMSTNNG